MTSSAASDTESARKRSLALVVFGAHGLMRAVGVHLSSTWLYSVIVIGLGLAGFTSLFSRAADGSG